MKKGTSVRHDRQRGAALLLAMLVLLTVATAVFVTSLSAASLRTRQIVGTQASLMAAKEALLAYAAVQVQTSAGRTALLPCPDLDDTGGLPEGVAHEDSCGAPGETVLGRVPWKTLGIEPPVDGGAACLWYAVSGSWKDAGASASSLVNFDTNGQLQVWGIESAAIINGQNPDQRPAAIVMAPMRPMAGQMRSAANGRRCSPDFNAGDFLDTDSGSGVSNAVLSGTPDAIDILATAAGPRDDHNDRIAPISRAELEHVIVARAGFDTDMRALGLAVAACIADYGLKNPGGATDLRLPWPAAVDVADYRPDSAYDDVNGGTLSGRLPDIVDDSSAQTGNPLSQALSLCDEMSVSQWSPAMLSHWQHWKDSFFYVVAESFAPDAALPSVCSNCLTVNAAGQYAAVVLFSNVRLPALNQVRDAPPLDTNTRDDYQNYLDGVNTAGLPYAGGGLDLVSQSSTATFNDLLFCIDATLVVSEC